MPALAASLSETDSAVACVSVNVVCDVPPSIGRCEPMAVTRCIDDGKSVANSIAS